MVKCDRCHEEGGQVRAGTPELLTKVPCGRRDEVEGSNEPGLESLVSYREES